MERKCSLMWGRPPSAASGFLHLSGGIGWQHLPGEKRGEQSVFCLPALKVLWSQASKVAALPNSSGKVFSPAPAGRRGQGVPEAFLIRQSYW